MPLCLALRVRVQSAPPQGMMGQMQGANYNWTSCKDVLYITYLEKPETKQKSIAAEQLSLINVICGSRKDINSNG